MVLPSVPVSGIGTRAEGTLANCGPDTELSYHCRGPACSSLDVGFQNIVCHRDGTSTLICSNDVKCLPGISSYQSNFTFSQNEPDPWSPVMENEPDTWVHQDQHVSIASCALFSLTSDGTKEGTLVHDERQAGVCPNANDLSASTLSGGSSATGRPQVGVIDKPVVFAGMSSRRTASLHSLVLISLFTFLLLLPGSYGSALYPYHEETLPKRNTNRVREFAEGFRIELARKSNQQGVNEDTFAHNLVAGVISSVCQSYFDNAKPRIFESEIAKDCVASVYDNEQTPQPAVRFLAVFGGSILCNYIISEAYPAGQDFSPNGCEGLQDLVTAMPTVASAGGFPASNSLPSLMADSATQNLPLAVASRYNIQASGDRLSTAGSPLMTPYARTKSPEIPPTHVATPDEDSKASYLSLASSSGTPIINTAPISALRSQISGSGALSEAISSTRASSSVLSTMLSDSTSSSRSLSFHSDVSSTASSLLVNLDPSAIGEMASASSLPKILTQDTPISSAPTAVASSTVPMTTSSQPWWLPSIRSDSPGGSTTSALIEPSTPTIRVPSQTPLSSFALLLPTRTQHLALAAAATSAVSDQSIQASAFASPSSSIVSMIPPSDLSHSTISSSKAPLPNLLLIDVTSSRVTSGNVLISYLSFLTPVPSRIIPATVSRITELPSGLKVSLISRSDIQSSSLLAHAPALVEITATTSSTVAGQSSHADSTLSVKGASSVPMYTNPPKFKTTEETTSAKDPILTSLLYTSPDIHVPSFAVPTPGLDSEIRTLSDVDILSTSSSMPYDSDPQNLLEGSSPIHSTDISFSSQKVGLFNSQTLVSSVSSEASTEITTAVDYAISLEPTARPPTSHVRITASFTKESLSPLAPTFKTPLFSLLASAGLESIVASTTSSDRSEPLRTNAAVYLTSISGLTASAGSISLTSTELAAPETVSSSMSTTSVPFDTARRSLNLSSQSSAARQMSSTHTEPTSGFHYEKMPQNATSITKTSPYPTFLTRSLSSTRALLVSSERSNFVESPSRTLEVIIAGPESAKSTMELADTYITLPTVTITIDLDPEQSQTPSLPLLIQQYTLPTTVITQFTGEGLISSSTRLDHTSPVSKGSLQSSSVWRSPVSVSAPTPILPKIDSSGDPSTLGTAQRTKFVSEPKVASLPTEPLSSLYSINRLLSTKGEPSTTTAKTSTPTYFSGTVKMESILKPLVPTVTTHLTATLLCLQSTAPHSCPGSGCVSLLTDKAHCGACHRICDHLCYQGVCVCPDFTIADANSNCSSSPGSNLCIEGYTRDGSRVCAPLTTMTRPRTSTSESIRRTTLTTTLSSTARISSEPVSVSASVATMDSPHSEPVVCPLGLPDICEGSCFNTKSEHNHCGGCGKYCSGSCVNGRCLVLSTQLSASPSSIGQTITTHSSTLVSSIRPTRTSVAQPIASYILRGLAGPR